MSTTLQDSSQKRIDDLRSARPRHHDPQEKSIRLGTGSPEAASALIGLLRTEPIDLAAVSKEIRRHRDLDILVLRLGVALALSPEGSILTVEESVVVLGTNRLRILIGLWSSAEGLRDNTVNMGPNSSLSAAPHTLEVRYLTNFMRYLGFDFADNKGSREHLAAWAPKNSREQIFVLTDLFMRDFFSLLPAIQPEIREAMATQDTLRTGSNQAR